LSLSFSQNEELLISELWFHHSPLIQPSMPDTKQQAI